MMIKPLPWDSAFFGRRIGRADVTQLDADTLATLKLAAAQTSYALVYVFAEEPSPAGVAIALADEKVRFSKSAAVVGRGGHQAASINYATWSSEQPATPVLYQLAIAAGVYSRFKLDLSFSEAHFEALYREWLDKSIAGELADCVMVATENGRPVGLITGKLKSGDLNIGLLSVAAAVQGKGVGRGLVEALIGSFLKTHHVDTLSVETQGRNTSAVRFYESIGFELVERVYIYHYKNQDHLRLTR